MTVTIELPPEVEANLSAQAQAEGLALPQYVERLLRRQVVPLADRSLSPEERAAAWVEAAKNLPRTPVLSDRAMSREGIYDDHD
jgi:hypothetical protein